MSRWRVTSRVLEGNPALARKINKYLKEREKITAAEWRTTIKPLLQSLRDDVVGKLKALPPGDWEARNAQKILNAVNQAVNEFGPKYEQALWDAQKKVGDLAAQASAGALKTVGLDTALPVFFSEEALAALKPLTQTISKFLSADISGTVGGIVSRGVVGGESVASVAKQITDAFSSDGNMSYARAERIAQTEMSRAASFTEMQRANELAGINPKARKIWVSSHRPGARQNHLDCEEKYINAPIPVDEPFVIPADLAKGIPEESCMYPNDPILSAANSVNCACTMTVINADDTEYIDSFKDAIK